MTRHRPERGSSKTLVAVSIDPVSSSMKLPAVQDGTRRARRETKAKRRTPRACGWRMESGRFERGRGWDQLLSFHETDRDGSPRAALLTRRSVTTRGRPLFLAVFHCTVPVCWRQQLPPPPTPEAYHGPVICHE